MTILHPLGVLMEDECPVDMVLEKLRACAKVNRCPMEIYKNLTEPGYNVHSHFFWEIQFHYQEHPNAEITKVLVIPPQVKHETTRMLPGKFIFCFSLGPDFFLGPHMNGSQKRTVSFQALDILRLHLTLLQQLADAPSHDMPSHGDVLSAHVRPLALTIIDLYQKALAEHDTFAKGDSFRQVAEYIDKHVCRPDFRLSSVSKALGIHRSNLGRMFRSNLHVTAKQYLIITRLFRACDMLQTSNFSITSIAHQTGWRSLCHFRATFKKVTGMTPRQYMLRCQNDKPFLPDGLKLGNDSAESVIDEFMRNMKKTATRKNPH